MSEKLNRLAEHLGQNKLKAALVVSGSATVVGLGLFVWNASAYYVGTVMTRWITMSVFFGVAIALPVIGIVVGALAVKASFKSYTEPQSPSRARDYYDLSPAERDARIEAWQAEVAKGSAGHAERVKIKRIVGIVGTVVSVAVIGAFFLPMYRSQWHATRAYAAKVVESDKAQPSWDIRPNRPQAIVDIGRNLGKTRGKLGDPTYVPNAPVPGWCAPVTAEAATGKTWTTAIVCRSDATGNVTKGTFPEATVGTTDGSWSSKLGDQIAEQARGAVYDDADVYGYLDADSKPHLVVPITRLGGGFTDRHDVAAGVVEFGPDGKAELHLSLKPGEIPGPVMPMSLAEKTREALNARDGLVAFDNPNRNANAYEATDAEGEAKTADPNADNPSEWVLRRSDGRIVYVTPLTPYGASSNVVAYLEVPADSVTAGSVPSATLYKLKEAQASMQTIAQTIASLYDADLDWAEANKGGDDSNKARLFEVTPTTDGQLSAVIGVGNRSLYRLTIDPALDKAGDFGEICVSAWDSETVIRCDKSNAQPVKMGALRGIASSDDEDQPSSSESPSGDLSEASTADLIAELDRRAREGSL